MLSPQHLGAGSSPVLNGQIQLVYCCCSGRFCRQTRCGGRCQARQVMILTRLQRSCHPTNTIPGASYRHPSTRLHLGLSALVLFVPSVTCGYLAYWQYERSIWKVSHPLQRSSNALQTSWWLIVQVHRSYTFACETLVTHFGPSESNERSQGVGPCESFPP